MKNFFVSYTGSDLNYATWVAEILEDNKYTVTIQAWDFKPGDNFVSKINEALDECEKLVIILSNSYLNSKWCETEWTTKLAEQIELNECRIIPIRIQPIKVRGLLSPIVYIDIVNKNESDAKEAILKGVEGNIERKSTGFPAYFNFQHLEIDIDYCIFEDYIKYTKTCTSKVIKGGDNEIHNRITWFPDEDIEVYPLTNRISIKQLNLCDTNLNYNVVFDHILKKDEIVTYKIEAKLNNKKKHFKNFVSTEVITPIDNLNIHLHIIDKSVNRVFTQKILSSPMNARTENPIEHTFNASYDWYINKPELNFEYKIYW